MHLAGPLNRNQTKLAMVMFPQQSWRQFQAILWDPLTFPRNGALPNLNPHKTIELYKKHAAFFYPGKFNVE